MASRPLSLAGNGVGLASPQLHSRVSPIHAVDITHMTRSLSVGVQYMVRSDLEPRA